MGWVYSTEYCMNHATWKPSVGSMKLYSISLPNRCKRSSSYWMREETQQFHNVDNSTASQRCTATNFQRWGNMLGWKVIRFSPLRSSCSSTLFLNFEIASQRRMRIILAYDRPTRDLVIRISSLTSEQDYSNLYCTLTFMCFFLFARTWENFFGNENFI